MKVLTHPQILTISVQSANSNSHKSPPLRVRNERIGEGDLGGEVNRKFYNLLYKQYLNGIIDE